MSRINQSKAIIGLIVLAGGLGLAVFLAASPTPAQKPDSTQPKITWSEKQVEVILAPGESATKTLAFSSTLDLSDAKIEAVPEIAGFLSIQPNSFGGIIANQPKQVSLGFGVPSGASRGRFNGTVHLGVGGQTLPATLKVIVHVAGTNAVIFLPPDPGEAGKPTMEGIDSDNDGVRDDIQRYIAFAYPHTEKTRSALSQYTRAQQAFLSSGEDNAQALAAASIRSRAADCIFYIRPSDARNLVAALRAEFLNTPERSRAYLSGDRKLSGEFYPRTPIDQWKNSCDFNPDTMKN